MGATTQVQVPTDTTKDHSRAVMTSHQPVMQAVKEQGEAQYIAGTQTEVDAAPQIFEVRQQQVVQGQVIQQTVEIPTVQEVVDVQEVPEVQVVNKIVEVPQ
eukprot:CAMPEP_0197646580 /NCGR_PEP_ID=MMETSP1338-20131121/23736_1 /TAXON_ID=43686 ORGANISM="Pelagodinium beii, Strain RCC1491" /NCGR_SAMPLE_ID=MMETSP1338 /ASSEMBLY_ACC=CAM_ASM_000754 /LENGTH=100 /DNA_ID=CAMNT_0043220229 /DNA_START=35 /DNA_END=334 /DNA_ORIENTATION=+